MDSYLSKVYACIDKIIESLANIGTKTKLPKSVRKDHVRNRKIIEFKIKYPDLRRMWTSSIRELIENKNSDHMNEIAQYLMNLLVNTRLKYDLDDDLCMAVIKLITIPVIGDIMDERELNCHGNHKQVLRKLLLYQMLINQPKIELGSIEEVSEVEENVNSQQQTQYINTAERSQNRLRSLENNENLSISGSQSRAPNSLGLSENSIQAEPPPLRTWEAVQVLNLLFDAITRHSKNITVEDADTISEIFHIINITYIIDILKDYFEHIKQGLFTVNRSYSSNTTRIILKPSELKKFHQSITDNLRLFPLHSQSVIFRSDLRSLQCQIRILMPLISQNEMI